MLQVGIEEDRVIVSTQPPCPLGDDFSTPLGFAVFAWQHSASRLLDCQDSLFTEQTEHGLHQLRDSDPV